MCWLESCRDHCPERSCSCQLAPQPVREASVKKYRLGSGRCKGTPLRTSSLLNQRRGDRNSASSCNGVSQDCLCWVQCHLIQNWRNLSCRRLWWMKGAKCEMRLVIEENFLTGMTVGVDRRDSSCVREARKDSGGEMIAFSRLKISPRKSMMREGINIDFSSLLSIQEIAIGWWFSGYVDDSDRVNLHVWSSRPDKHGPGFPEIVTAEPQGLRSWWTHREP